MRFATLFALLLSLVFCQAAPAQFVEPLDDALNLVDDSGAWYTTVFVSGRNSADEQRLVSWFSTNHQLKRLKESTHFAVISPKDSIWQRYWNGTTDANGVVRPPKISSVPAVVVQRPNGDGSYTPVARLQAPIKYFETDSMLANALAKCIHQHSPAQGAKRHPLRPWLDCDDCQPGPNPKPDPGPDPYIEPKPLIPSIEPIEEEEEEDAKDEVETATVEDAIAKALEEDAKKRLEAAKKGVEVEAKDEDGSVVAIASALIASALVISVIVAYLAQRNRQV